MTRVLADSNIRTSRSITLEGAHMKRRRPLSILTTAAVIPLVALVVAGCGGDDNGNQATAASPPKASGGGSATIGVANAGSLGKILVNSQGRTVYLFKKDTGPKSTCFGACATQWPPVTTNGKPKAGSGLTASKVGTTARSGGQKQVTYNGHPLYLFAGDNSPGDTAGQGVNAFGASWFVLSPAGNQITTKASSSGGNGIY
jgi:predicted lipoprotein with Yx(FWY)xxD motif